MTTTFLILIGSLLLVVPLVVRPLLKRLADYKMSQLNWATKFYDVAPSLIADERISDEMADLLQFMSNHVDDKGLLRVFIPKIVNRGSRSSKNKTAKQLAFDETVENLPEDLRESFRSALAFGILTLSYSSVIQGTLLRTILLAPVGMPQRTTDAPHFAYRAFAHC